MNLQNIKELRCENRSGDDETGSSAGHICLVAGVAATGLLCLTLPTRQTGTLTGFQTPLAGAWHGYTRPWLFGCKSQGSLLENI